MSDFQAHGDISGWQQVNLKKKHKQHLFIYFLTSWQTSSGNFLKSANTKWQSLVETMSLKLLEVYKSQAQERPPAEVFDAGPEKNRTESTGANQSGHPLKWCGSKWNILCIWLIWLCQCIDLIYHHMRKQIFPQFHINFLSRNESESALDHPRKAQITSAEGSRFKVLKVQKS